MKHISCYYKRLKVRKIKIAILAVFVSIFFLPSYVPFEKVGNNIFTVFLNNVEIGTVADPEDARRYALEARKRIAGEGTELVLAESNLETEGREVLWEKMDEPSDIVDRMTQVLTDNIKETLHRSYVVKINEYMVNLSSKEDVIKLLQAALDKYDAEGKYQAGLRLVSARELTVLTTEIQTREEVAAKEEAQETVNMEAGVLADLSAAVENATPAGELDFEDYDLGLISIAYGDEIEVVEAYLPESELTDVQSAINEVTKEEEKNDVYEVVSGDTLSEIAIKVNIPMDKLIEMNESLEDENSMIRPGDELIITIPELTAGAKEQLEADNQTKEIEQQTSLENLEAAENGITAEFDGVVTQIDATEGQVAANGSQILKLESTEDVAVRITVTKYDLDKIKIGQSAKVTIGSKEYQGEVSKIDKMAEKNNSGATVVGTEIKITNPDSDVILGVEAKVVISTAREENVIIVPVTAVNVDVDGEFVYTVENNVLLKKPVQTGISSDTYVQITEGLSEGEQVVTEVSSGLTEGMMVLAMPEE